MTDAGWKSKPPIQWHIPDEEKDFPESPRFVETLCRLKLGSVDGIKAKTQLVKLVEQVSPYHTFSRYARGAEAREYGGTEGL